jgi:hypothetical protein
VNECTPEGWQNRAGAAVAGRASQWESSCRGAGGAVPSRIVLQCEDRSDLVNDPNYPSEAVVREVARKLADLFCGE